MNHSCFDRSRITDWTYQNQIRFYELQWERNSENARNQQEHFDSEWFEPKSHWIFILKFKDFQGTCEPWTEVSTTRQAIIFRVQVSCVSNSQLMTWVDKNYLFWLTQLFKTPVTDTSSPTLNWVITLNKFMTQSLGLSHWGWLTGL